MGVPLDCQPFILLRKSERGGRVSSLGLVGEQGGRPPRVCIGGQLIMNDKWEEVCLRWCRDIGTESLGDQRLLCMKQRHLCRNCKFSIHVPCLTGLCDIQLGMSHIQFEMGWEAQEKALEIGQRHRICGR